MNVLSLSSRYNVRTWLGDAIGINIDGSRADVLSVRQTMTAGTAMTTGIVIGRSLTPVAVVISQQVVFGYVRVVVVSVIIFVIVVVISWLPVFACQPNTRLIKPD